jgi:large subunit ribosomal protein L21
MFMKLYCIIFLIDIHAFVSYYFKSFYKLFLEVNMYAILETGSKQYQVEKGDVINVELIPDQKIIEFKNILMINDGKKVFIGSPHLENCSVQAEVIGEEKGPKVVAFKYRRRKDSKRKQGHRQKYLKVKITEIKQGKEK